jgi:dTDP-glucose 4,6-dehydratase
VLECAQKVIEITGSRSGIRHEPAVEDDPTRRRPDITKARALLGWEPTIDLRKGLELCLPYFRGRM